MGIIVDLFAGGGGASQGIFQALGRHPDAAVNHDPVAVAVHSINHPVTRHYCQDVWTVHPAWVSRGQAVDLLWASPDCTHHSKAKGGAPTRNERRRDLAMVIADKWLPALKPRRVILENVEEFEDWGPLDSAGRIVESAKGQKFREFLNRFRRHGYAVEYRQLRACDYGAPTTRNRLYLIARCDGLPIVWPEPTHGAPDSIEVLTGYLKPWRTAAECIDFSLPCPSIFETSAEIKAKYGLQARRPLKEATLRRIFRGLEKYVLKNPQPFIVKNYTGAVGQSKDNPLGTVTTIDHHSLVVPYLNSYYGEKREGEVRGRSVSEPPPTQTTENRFALISPVITSQAHAVACASLVRDFGCSVGADCNSPAPTVMTSGAGKTGLVTAHMVTYHGRSEAAGADEPTRTVLTKEHLGLVTSHIAKMRGTNTGQSQNSPMQTITSGGYHFAEVRAFLTKYYGEGGQDQSAVGLVTVHGEDYAIADIGMRMLQPKELLLAMGFPSSYLIGFGPCGMKTTKTEQVRLIGNAVCPDVAAALVRANMAAERAEEFFTSQAI